MVPRFNQFVYELATNEETGFRWRFGGAVPSPARFEEGLWSGVLCQFVVQGRKMGHPIGMISAYAQNLAEGHCWLGGVFSTRAQSTGMPVDAFATFIAYIFSTWNLRKIYMELPEYNAGKVQTSLGMRTNVEGRLREHFFFDGRWWDSVIFALDRTDHFSEEAVSGIRTEGG
jgi:RimJ/RimL family protein N-acetyltransferase